MFEEQQSQKSQYSYIIYIWMILGMAVWVAYRCRHRWQTLISICRQWLRTALSQCIRSSSNLYSRRYAIIGQVHIQGEMKSEDPARHCATFIDTAQMQFLKMLRQQGYSTGVVGRMDLGLGLEDVELESGNQSGSKSGWLLIIPIFMAAHRSSSYG